jgi:hypothetical protein
MKLYIEILVVITLTLSPNYIFAQDLEPSLQNFTYGHSSKTFTGQISGNEEYFKTNSCYLAPAW